MSTALWIVVYALTAAAVAAGPTAFVWCNRRPRKWVAQTSQLVWLAAWMSAYYYGAVRTGVWVLVPLYAFFAIIQMCATIWYFDRRERRQRQQVPTT